MATIEQRIEALEQRTITKEHRPFPREYYYGKPLPEDFYTNDKYTKLMTRDEFYGRTPKDE